MAITLSIVNHVSAIVNGRYQEAGEIHDPVSLATSADIFRDDEIALTGAATTQIYAATSAAKYIRVEPTVAITLIEVGTTAADNNAILLAAGQPYTLSGQMTAYSATVAGRAAAATQTITALHAVHTGTGAVRVTSFR